jgi:hypothetical protein
VTVQDLEAAVMTRGESLVVPPHWLSYYYFRWARTADPLLYQNPVWWQCIEWVNLLCLMPFAAVAARAFYKGWNWIRIPAIIVSAFTFYSLILCIGASLFHENAAESRTRQPAIFFFIYVPYLIFPVLVVARMWHEAPFSRPLPGSVDTALKAVASVTYAAFVAAGVAWYFACEATAEAKAACEAGGASTETVPAWLQGLARGAGMVVYGLAAAAGGAALYRLETGTGK